ncbi:MAG: type II toxin-antitoxin system RelE/ParE family toxin [Sulfurovum sp.]|nr:type II toxin-antitoxin system RelE/ParE family toxin [Sulfurovum sp.]
MKIEFLKLAKLEFDEAIIYYEKESEGLGIRFKKEIRSCIDMIIQFPTLYPITENHVHKCVSHTFPYSIFYTYENETIVIYAIANHFREPSTYSNRHKIQ